MPAHPQLSEACSDIYVVRLQLDSVGESKGCTLRVRVHHGSLSGVLYRCARHSTTFESSDLAHCPLKFWLVEFPIIIMQHPSHAETF